MKRMQDDGVFELNLRQMLVALWKSKFLIAAFAVMFAGIAYLGSYYLTVPQYKSDILIYVNNSSASRGETSVTFSSGELNAARQLLDSYVVVLQSRSCLDAVIEKADLPYTREQLKSRISATSVNDTEWFTVSVTSHSPEEAQNTANAIAEVLPELLSETIKGSSVVVLDYARLPSSRIPANHVTHAGIGFLIGFLLSALAVAAKELLNDKIRSEETLSEISNMIPVLATIPHNRVRGSYPVYGYEYGRKGKRKKRKKKKSKTSAVFADICDELDFAAAESYRLLQTSVQYSFEKGGCKVIGITGSERNEGKTTLAINLAYMLSCDKKKVLLLEGDMRLPSISRKLGVEPIPGLSDLLTGKAMWNEGIQHSDKAPELSVICAGVVPPNPFALLGSASMERLLTELRELFDYIIVDLPPVNIVSDPLAVSRYLDGFIVVVRSEYTTKKGARDVVEKLRVVNANITGYVINNDGRSRESRHTDYGKYARAYEASYAKASAGAKHVPPVSPENRREKET